MTYITVITFLLYTGIVAWYSWYKTRSINLNSSMDIFSADAA